LALFLIFLLRLHHLHSHLCSSLNLALLAALSSFSYVLRFLAPSCARFCISTFSLVSWACEVPTAWALRCTIGREKNKPEAGREQEESSRGESCNKEKKR